MVTRTRLNATWYVHCLSCFRFPYERTRQAVIKLTTPNQTWYCYRYTVQDSPTPNVALSRIQYSCEMLEFYGIEMKTTAFWDVTPCCLVGRYNVSQERIASIFRVQEWKLGRCLRKYAASHPRKQLHSLREYSGTSCHGKAQDQADHTNYLNMLFK